jgi:PAS domain S-box-containing protein/putative nucleotidyltransferase with HDIG domain
MRANRAYAEQAGMKLKELIGKPYWECFPKGDGPLQSCTIDRRRNDSDEHDEEINLENGDILLSRAFAIRNEDGSYRYSIHIIEDITFERRAKQTLKESEGRFRKLFEKAPLAYQSIDSKGRILEVNQAWEELLGYEREQVIGHPFEEYLCASSRDKYHNNQQIHSTLQDNKPLDLEICRRDGSERLVTIQGRFSHSLSGKETISHCILTDITERKRAEAALLLKDQVFESALSANSIADINGVITTVNRAFIKCWGYERHEEVLGKPISDFLFSEEAARDIITALKSVGTWEGEFTALCKDGSTFDAYAVATSLKDLSGRLTGYQSSVLDITEWKHSEEVLHDEQQRAQSYLDIAPVIIVALNDKGQIDLINLEGCKVLGYQEHELIGREWFENFIPQQQRKSVRQVFAQLMSGNIELVTHHENQVITQNGEQRLIEWNNSVIRDPDGTIIGLLSSGEDITKRRTSELELKNLNQMLRTAQTCNEALVRATDEPVLIQQICDILANHVDFSLVWVGLFGSSGHDFTVTHSSDSCESVETFNNQWNEDDGPSPALEAMRSGKIQVIHASDSGDAFQAYRKQIAAIGCFSIAAMPLMHMKRSIGLMMVYSYKNNVFNQQQVDLLEELANDLAYGITSLRTNIEREHMGQRLEQNLLQTVQAIAMTLETRDPYTAGHQRRVTELSLAIASAMGLDEQQIEGIRFGATIHDIGKIHIPAEILNRPGRLNELEFGLIKTHPEVGLEIVKEIEFPWPVADIIHQHHERLDGSGYPQGLKGDEIILEARILAVADVVEAMSSHRPYRPGLGIEAALDEISKNRGIFYDPLIVDTCIKLFNDKQFAFSDSF